MIQVLKGFFFIGFILWYSIGVMKTVNNYFRNEFNSHYEQELHHQQVYKANKLSQFEDGSRNEKVNNLNNIPLNSIDTHEIDTRLEIGEKSISHIPENRIYSRSSSSRTNKPEVQQINSKSMPIVEENQSEMNTVCRSNDDVYLRFSDDDDDSSGGGGDESCGVQDNRDGMDDWKINQTNRFCQNINFQMILNTFNQCFML